MHPRFKSWNSNGYLRFLCMKILRGTNSLSDGRVYLVFYISILFILSLFFDFSFLNTGFLFFFPGGCNGDVGIDVASVYCINYQACDHGEFTERSGIYWHQVLRPLFSRGSCLFLRTHAFACQFQMSLA